MSIHIYIYIYTLKHVCWKPIPNSINVILFINNSILNSHENPRVIAVLDIRCSIDVYIVYDI